jgi:hypothetical protein
MRISRLVPALLVVLLLSTSAGAQLNPFGAYYSNIARAAASNDAARVNELVGLGSNPNETDDSGYAGLHYAAMNGNLPMIAVLIKAGARIDQRDRLGNTPLALAAARGQDAAAELLIAAGADVNARNGDGVTPLMIAARRGDLDLVRALLARGADPRMLDYTGHDAANWAADSRPDRQIMPCPVPSRRRAALPAMGSVTAACVFRPKNGGGKCRSGCYNARKGGGSETPAPETLGSVSGSSDPFFRLAPRPADQAEAQQSGSEQRQGSRLGNGVRYRRRRRDRIIADIVPIADRA